MKLNPDCIRDILLEVEKASSLTSGLCLDIDNKNPIFDKYLWDEITYHIYQCEMHKLITSSMIFESDGYATIDDLTPKGHEFLANIRKDTNWNKIKQCALKVGSLALPIIQQIASNVIKEQI